DAPVASLVVACDAVLKGPPYALEQARRLADGDVKFKETVATAGQMLMNVREYPGAAALLEAGASGASTARTMGLVAVLRRAKRHEELTFSSDAEGFIRHMLVTMMAGPLSIESLISFSSRNARLDTESLAPEEREQTLQALNGVLAVATRSGVPLDVMIDISLQAMQVKSLGNDALGYRELVQGPNMRDQNFFIVREDGEFRVLDTAEKPIEL